VWDVLNYNFSESTLLLRAWTQFSMSASHRVFLENYRGFFCSLVWRRPTEQLVKRSIRETGSARYVFLSSRGIVLFLDLERTEHDKKRTVDGTRAFKRPYRFCLTNLVIKMNILSAFMTFCEHANLVHCKNVCTHVTFALSSVRAVLHRTPLCYNEKELY